MTMRLFHAASRDALAASEQKLLEVLNAKPAARTKAVSAEQLGDELLSVVRMLDGEIGLRRVLGDSSAERERREPAHPAAVRQGQRAGADGADLGGR